GDFHLKNSIITLHTQTETNVVTGTFEKIKDETIEDIEKFEWPDFKIAISEIDMEGNTISYFVGKDEVKKDLFNPNAIALQDFTLRAKSIFLKDKEAGIVLEELAFREG